MDIEGDSEQEEEACSGGGTQVEDPLVSDLSDGEEEEEVMETPLTEATEGVSRPVLSSLSASANVAATVKRKKARVLCLLALRCVCVRVFCLVPVRQ